MFSDSIIDPETVQAYLETEYRVYAEPGFTLKVGQASAELHSAQASRQVDCSAFLTACNPFSASFDAASNAAKQAALAAELKRQGLSFLPGLGQHPANGWPGEESFLIFGLPLETAKSLANRLEQNGLIWSGTDAVPQLILLR